VQGSGVCSSRSAWAGRVKKRMGKKILLADDSITIQKVIELTFSDEDFDVVTVGNGRLALEKLPEVRPDIVLCDIIMPEKDGYEVCEQIKHNTNYAHIPVLLLTGAFEPFDQDRATRAGYDGSLAKPFEPETLIAKVKELLSRAPAQAGPAPSTAPPSVVPFQRPGVPPMPAAPPAPARTPSFIPDEPLVGEEEAAFVEDDTVAAPPAAEPLVEMSQEEVEALAPPEGGHAEHDSASTVMFRAADLPWNAPKVPERSSSAGVAAFEPEPTEAPEVVVDDQEPESGTQAFEEVLEEDLEFGPDSFRQDEPAGSPADEGSSTVMFTPDPGTLPPLSREQEAATGPFANVDARRQAAPVHSAHAHAPEERPAPHSQARDTDPTLPAREPVLRPEPGNPRAPGWDAPPRASGTPPVPAAAQGGTTKAAEPPPRERSTESFADLSEGEDEAASPAPPVSEAAGVSVPVDMVEKIAQRVVAQISEKAVREIAWEVIPDLAEALIKQEIERLKAELQKL
jgi:CheY-like chemotaxis protein